MKNQTRDRPVRHVLRRGALRTALARASLRVRVMAAAAVLVAVTSVRMGLLGTVLLRGYLFGRVDAQLRKFSAFISKAASRSAVPSACVNIAFTISPLRFSINTCPRYPSLASWPDPFRYNRASGSVFDSCVSLLRFSPRNCPGSSSPPSFF